MWTLNRPGPTARHTYALCISRITDAALKNRLESIKPVIEATSTAFDTSAVSQLLHTFPREAPVGGIVTTTEMERVYTQRLARRGGPARRIYDELMTAPAHGKCPLCGHRTVKTLDHHLPKAHYPALAVTPLNLVPCCTDCNKAKLDAVPDNEEQVSLHPYYDNIDGSLWLRADVLQTQPAALQFFVQIPATWSAVLAARVHNHFEMMGLAKLYASEAAEELSSIRQQMTDIDSATGAQGVRAELAARALSCASSRRNAWRTATYDAWADSDWFCDGGFALT